MKHIGEALERARASQAPGESNAAPEFIWQVPRVASGSIALEDTHPRTKEVILDAGHLESRRIIAYDRSDQRSRCFEMLRTQVLQSMDQNGWQLLAVTSATPGCGKTSTAVNLAMSIARQPDRSVLLVDFDLQKPAIAGCLGLHCEHGVLSVLEGKSSLSDSIIQARIGNHQLLVLPCEAPMSNSSELMVSRSMSSMLEAFKVGSRPRIVILDLPPILSGDDVIAILPQIDCALFVIGIGLSTSSDVKECNKHLQRTPIVRVVANKAADWSPPYYYY